MALETVGSWADAFMDKCLTMKKPLQYSDMPWGDWRCIGYGVKYLEDPYVHQQPTLGSQFELL